MQRLRGLDSIRGIAALIVAVGHAFHLAGVDTTGRFYLAVDLFFVLSGYVMARTYEGPDLKAERFIKVRLRRLWPTMAVGTVIGALALSNLHPQLLATLFLASLLWAPTLGDGPAYPLNPPLWSIAGEFVANILHAAILARVSTQAVAAVSALCAVTLFYFSPITLDIGVGEGHFALAFPRALMGYCFGIVIFRLVRDRPLLPFWPVFLLPLVLVLPVPDYLFAIVATPALIVCGLAGKQMAPLDWLGRISFPLYAIHLPLMMIFGPWTGLLAALPAAWLMTKPFHIAVKRRAS